MNKIFSIILLLLLTFAISARAEDSTFQPGKAKVTASVLNVRNISSSGGTVVASLKRGDIVDVVEKSQHPSDIDGVSDYWYKISLPKKKSGWVFGQFISFELNLESGLRWKSSTPDRSQKFTSIAISDSGIMMAGTQSGNIFISSDNGKNFRKVLPQALGVSIGKINSIFISKDTIWIAAGGDTNGGVWKSTNNGNSWAQYTTSQGLISNETYDIVDSGGILYVATKKGLCISKNSGMSFSADDDLDMETNSLSVSSDGNIAAGTTKGLYIYMDKKNPMKGTKKSWEKISSKTPNMGSKVFTAAISPTGEIYVGTDKGLAKSLLSNINEWFSIGGKVEVNSIIIDSNSRVIVATNNGLNISLDQGGSWVTYKSENGLASNEIHRVSISPKTGVIWTISSNAGLSYHE